LTVSNAKAFSPLDKPAMCVECIRKGAVELGELLSREKSRTEGLVFDTAAFCLAMHLTVKSKSIKFPNLCCCCGREPDRNLEVSGQIGQAFATISDVPCCSQCLKHMKVYRDNTGRIIPLAFFSVLPFAVFGIFIESRVSAFHWMGMWAAALGPACGLAIALLAGKSFHHGKLLPRAQVAKELMGPGCWAPDERSCVSLFPVHGGPPTLTLRGSFAAEVARLNPDSTSW
jgi:hypothetical protein